MKKIVLISLSAIILCLVLDSCKDNSDDLPLIGSKDKNANEVAYSFIQKQQELDAYEIVTSGKTVAEKIIKYTQNIDTITVKSGDIYCSESNSSSTFVNVNHKMATNGKSVAYTDTKGNIIFSTESEYRNIYGIMPNDMAIGGLVFNEETILSSELVSDSQEILKYRYILDCEKSTENIKKQMKEFGSLKEQPSFLSLEIYLSVKDDMTPISYEIHAKYKINIAVLGRIECTQTLFSEFRIGNDMENTDLINFANELEN